MQLLIFGFIIGSLLVKQQSALSYSITPKLLATTLSKDEIETFFEVVVPSRNLEKLLFTYSKDIELIYYEACSSISDMRLHQLLQWISNDRHQVEATFSTMQTNVIPSLRYKLLSNKCLDRVEKYLDPESLAQLFLQLGPIQQLLGQSDWMVIRESEELASLLEHAALYGPSLESYWYNHIYWVFQKRDWVKFNVNWNNIWQVLVTTESVQVLGTGINAALLFAPLTGTIGNFKIRRNQQIILSRFPSENDRILRFLWAEAILFNLLSGFDPDYNHHILWLLDFIKYIAPIGANIMSIIKPKFFEHLVAVRCSEPIPRLEVAWCAVAKELYSSNPIPSDILPNQAFVQLWDAIHNAQLTKASPTALLRYRLLVIARFFGFFDVDRRDYLLIALQNCSAHHLVNPYDIKTFVILGKGSKYFPCYSKIIEAQCGTNEQVLEVLLKIPEFSLAGALNPFRIKSFYTYNRKIDHQGLLPPLRSATPSAPTRGVLLNSVGGGVLPNGFAIQCQGFVEEIGQLIREHQFINIPYYYMSGRTLVPISTVSVFEQLVLCIGNQKNSGLLVLPRNPRNILKRTIYMGNHPYKGSLVTLNTFVSLLLKCIVMGEHSSIKISYLSLRHAHRLIGNALPTSTTISSLEYFSLYISRYFEHFKLNLSEFYKIFN